MAQNNKLTVLFNDYARQEKPPVIILQNKYHEPVAAIYLSTLRVKKLIVSETNNSEAYYLYIDGIGIYFTYFEISGK